MLRQTSTVCRRCQLTSRPLHGVTQWRSLRQATHPSKAQPARMELSARVADSRPKKPKRRGDGPWGNTNLTKASIRGLPEKGGAKRDDKKDKKKDEGAFKALKMHRALAQVSYGQRTRVKAIIKEVDKFDKFPLLPLVQKSIHDGALQGLVDIKPTPAQRLAIPALLGVESGKKKFQKAGERADFLLAAETGSGKTLSYTLPLVDAIKRAEAEDEEVIRYESLVRAEANNEIDPNDPTSVPEPSITERPHPTTGRPRAVILVPTSELVDQVGEVIKSICHTVKFRAALISSSYSAKVIRNRLFSPRGIDLVVSTPHLLSSITESDPNVLSRVTHLVVDEADSLLDRGFLPLTTAIIDRASPSLKQLVFCSATIPRSMDNYLRKRHPEITRLVTPNLHAIPRRVQLGVIDVQKPPYMNNKDLACADCIWTIAKSAAEHQGPDPNQTDVKRIVVFVNEREKSIELADYLKSKNIDAIALNRDTQNSRDSELLASFTTRDRMSVEPEEAQPAPAPAPEAPKSHGMFGEPRRAKRLNNAKVLVTTDLGSRGIDTIAVRHVILYDVPHSTVDFIHRLGRTGRMGRRGRGIVLVGKDDRRDVVREVQEGMFMGQALL